MGCTLDRVKGRCGCDAVDVVRRLLVALGGPVFNVYCGAYDEFSCEQSNASVTDKVNVKLLAALAMLSFASSSSSLF